MLFLMVQKVRGQYINIIFLKAQPTLTTKNDKQNEEKQKIEDSLLNKQRNVCNTRLYHRPYCLCVISGYCLCVIIIIH